MSGRGRLALCAWAATLMASGALLPLVDPVTWIVQAALLLAVQSGVGELVRRVAPARPLTVLAQAAVTLVALTAVFAGERAVAGLLPGPEVFQRFGALLTAGAEDVGRYAIPAPATDGIRLMLVGGVLLIGLVVDTLAVTFRSAAPAGLPLLALYSVAAGLSGGGAGWLWFLLAASGYLLLLLAEGRDRLSRWGRVFGGAPPSRGAGVSGAPGGAATAPVRTGRRIGAVALGIALAVPAVLPSLGGGLLNGQVGGGQGGGTISAVNPLVSLQDNLNQPEDREVLRYRTTAQDTSGQYLRLVALDQFDGTSWKSSERRVQDVPEELPRPDGLREGVSASPVTTRISAAGSYEQKYLPMPFPATKVEIEGGWRYEPAGRTLVGDSEQTTRGKRYTVTSLQVEPTAERLAGSPAPPGPLLREYTRVPDTLPGDVRATAVKVTRGAGSDYERAVKLQDWFSVDGGFTYDTDVSSGTGAAAISRFLKEKEGFCVHFSFSMAAMARTLGIPARVAVGFMPGSPQADGIMSVGIRDAHAWPELYFEGVGWTRFEPTPTRGTVPQYARAQAPSSDATAPAQPEVSAQPVPSAEPSADDGCPARARRLGDCGTPAALDVPPPTEPGTPAGTVLLVALAGAAALLVPLLPVLWRTRVRARRLGPGGRAAGDVAARTLAVWREVVDTAWDHGVAPDESRSPRGTAERIVRLGGLRGDSAEAAHRVAGAVEQVLYAPVPRPAAGLAEDAARVRAGLRAACGPAARARAVLVPRSAVRVLWAGAERWAAVTGRWAAGRRRIVERWAGAVRRPSRQRGRRAV
ncbi:DUF3488 and transglutaminase-like domain-containing protein [Streptomyces sp. NPDC050856]|uniref:DUF3488 and transglutaminase-like domain-containing protein n=1 Tax=Streptomyces sp. NPDC050856 TaxID=3154939 RepID=UPI0033D937F2